MMLLMTIEFSLIFLLSLSIMNNAFARLDNSLNVAAVGDISCNKNGKQTISSMANNHPNLVLFLGDLYYDNSLSCFFDQIKILKNDLQHK
jgi:phosphodiesterase/alkaline phosphatase D-like protein